MEEEYNNTRDILSMGTVKEGKEESALLMTPTKPPSLV